MNHLIEVRESHFKLLSTLNAAPLWRPVTDLWPSTWRNKCSIVRQKQRWSQQTVCLRQQKGEPDADATGCPPSFFLLLRICTWGQRYRLRVQFNFVNLDTAGWCVGWGYDSSPQEYSIFPGSWQLRGSASCNKHSDSEDKLQADSHNVNCALDLLSASSNQYSTYYCTQPLRFLLWSILIIELLLMMLQPEIKCIDPLRGSSHMVQADYLNPFNSFMMDL